MNILLITPWLPWPPHDGARIRLFETLRYLSTRHQVTLLATIAHPRDVQYAAALKNVCTRVETTVLLYHTPQVVQRLAQGVFLGIPLIQSAYYDTKLAQRVRTLTAEEHYDIVQIELSYAARYVRAISPQCSAKRVLSMHNIETIRYAREMQLTLRYDRWLATLWDRVFFPTWEEQVVQQFDGIVTVSELERAWVQRHAPRTATALVPNGVDTECFAPRQADTAKSNPIILFTGAMDYPPNIDAVRWFCDIILPLLQRRMPQLCFKIVGRDPHAKVCELGRRPGIRVTGEVDDIHPYLAEALALVVPLRAGGGTRLKILQAMAMGCPVISTPLGAEGLEVTPDVNILLAENAEQFVRHVLVLAAAPETAARLGQAGRRLVTEKYHWHMCLQGLETLYNTLCEHAAA